MYPSSFTICIGNLALFFTLRRTFLVLTSLCTILAIIICIFSSAKFATRLQHLINFNEASTSNFTFSKSNLGVLTAFWKSWLQAYILLSFVFSGIVLFLTTCCKYIFCLKCARAFLRFVHYDAPSSPKQDNFSIFLLGQNAD